MFKTMGAKQGRRLYKKCQNYAMQSVCNWMIPVGRAPQKVSETFCAPCRLNQTIFDLSRRQSHTPWHRTEIAKRRLVYTLLNFQLPIAGKTDDPKQGLAFAFLDDRVKPDGGVSRVLTGDDNGLITLNIAEADDSVREKIRLAMRKHLRTLLGHFRHKIGHYDWGRPVRGTKFIEGYRELFGNDEADYRQALKPYYPNGAPKNWQENFISGYRTAHPSEDWAASSAHFMHIQDALEVANDFGLVGKFVRLDPNRTGRKPWLSSEQLTFEGITGRSVELTIALNSRNRCMGLQDPYPFVLSPAATLKLGFIYEVICAQAAKVAHPA